MEFPFKTNWILTEVLSFTLSLLIVIHYFDVFSNSGVVLFLILDNAVCCLSHIVSMLLLLRYFDCTVQSLSKRIKKPNNEKTKSRAVEILLSQIWEDLEIFPNGSSYSCQERSFEDFCHFKDYLFEDFCFMSLLPSC